MGWGGEWMRKIATNMQHLGATLSRQRNAGFLIDSSLLLSYFSLSLFFDDVMLIIELATQQQSV